MSRELTHIVLYKTDTDADRLVVETLSKHFPRVAVVDNLKDLCKQLVDPTPKVLLITGESVAESLTSFYRALDVANKMTICEYRVVCLIPRHSEEEAYLAFRSGVIDDYLVSRPLYEVHRIILICEHLLIELGVSFNLAKNDLAFVKQSDKYTDDTKQLLIKETERKDAMRSAFETSIIEIDNALDGAIMKIQKQQAVHLDMNKIKDILAAIRSDEIRPELIQLQQKAMNLLGKMVDTKTREIEAAQPPAEETQGGEQADGSGAAKSTTPVEFNRLYNQQVDPDELLDQQRSIPEVLMVEDDSISIQLTRKLLSGYHINLDVMTTGRKAFAALTAKHYNLVLMDVNLPDTNGIYIVDQVVKGQGLNMETPIIMLTGDKNKATVAQAIKRGAKGYIIKPLYKASVMKLFEKYGLPLKATSP